jgi:ubiquinone/menaquinone biosynthesis C-methylase UbiE
MQKLRKLLLMEDMLCPWWLAYTFDHRLRRLVHNPEKILSPYVREGMTALDIGCGMGFFSISMAKLVGNSGAVIAVDLQQKMLDNLEKRAKHAGVADRIIRHRCEPENIGNHQNIDFTLTFWMVHEVPNSQKFLTQIYAALKPGGKYLLVEPKIHVSAANFEKTVKIAGQVGFKMLETPQVAISRAVLFGKG